jgi:hypothetical protein
LDGLEHDFFKSTSTLQIILLPPSSSIPGNSLLKKTRYQHVIHLTRQHLSGKETASFDDLTSCDLINVPIRIIIVDLQFAANPSPFSTLAYDFHLLLFPSSVQKEAKNKKNKKQPNLTFGFPTRADPPLSLKRLHAYDSIIREVFVDILHIVEI